MSSTTRLLLAAALFACAPLTTYADATAKGKKVALLVGVVEYDHADLPDLKHAENDVEELGKVLAAPAFDTVITLTTGRGKKDAALKPTAENIRARLKELTKKITKHDILLIALAGHGLQFTLTDPNTTKERTESFFCPTDAKPRRSADFDELKKNLIPLHELFKELEDSGAGVKLMLVDACRNDPKIGRNVDVDTLPRPSQGTAALFSCKSGEKAYESDKLGKGHGVFFHFVIEGLTGRARTERGDITWNRLAEYVVDKVSDEVPTIVGATARQTPHEIKNITGKPVVLLRSGAIRPTPKPPVKVVRGLDPKELIGDWTTTRLRQIGSTTDIQTTYTKTVTLTATEWIFNKGIENSTEYEIKIDGSKEPATIDFTRKGEDKVFGTGIVKHEGDGLRILYVWTTNRPTSFDNPDKDVYEITLRRGKPAVVVKPAKDAVDLKTLLGEWTCTRLRSGGSANDLDLAQSSTETVSLAATEWTFNKNLNNPVSYDIKIDTSKSPATIDFFRKGETAIYGRGILKREGASLRVAYEWTDNRPSSFDNLGKNAYELTLRPANELVDARSIAGNWKAVSLVKVGSKEKQDAAKSGVATVRITPTQIIFDPRGGGTTYELKVDGTRTPARIDFFAKAGDTTPYGTGILKRDGARLRLIYDWSANRPGSFDNAPDGTWDLVLERDPAGEGLALRDLLGNWKTVSLTKAGANQAGISAAKITATTWLFDPATPGASYTIKFDGSKNPAQLDFYTNATDATPYGTAIVRREGNRLRVIYDWTANRPTNFDKPRDSDWNLLLERDTGEKKLDIKDLLGSWKTVSLRKVGSDEKQTGVSAVKITATTWQFDPTTNGTSYVLKVDLTKNPAQLDFYSNANDPSPYGTAIARLEGKRLRIIYDWTTTRPASFDKPKDGDWELVLERE